MQTLHASAPAAMTAESQCKGEQCGTCDAGGERSLEDYTFTGSGQSAEASLADQAAQSAAASTFEVSAAISLPLRACAASAETAICIHILFVAGDTLL